MTDYIFVDDNKVPATEKKAPLKKIKMEMNQSIDTQILVDKSSIMNFTAPDDEV